MLCFDHVFGDRAKYSAHAALNGIAQSVVGRHALADKPVDGVVTGIDGQGIGRPTWRGVAGDVRHITAQRLRIHMAATDRDAVAVVIDLEGSGEAIGELPVQLAVGVER